MVRVDPSVINLAWWDCCERYGVVTVELMAHVLGCRIQAARRVLAAAGYLHLTQSNAASERQRERAK